MARSWPALSSLVLVFVLAGCPGPEPTIDGGADAPTADTGSDGGPACTRASDCDDGLFCNGEETCTEGRCVAGADPCDDGIACTLDSCAESREVCVSTPPDEDSDGYVDASCLDGSGAPLGDDCDDGDADRFPGNREICDADDEDCDPATRGGIDDDGDGYESAVCCNDGVCGDDCDDARIGSFPGATEVCDGLDQNCDGTADDGLLLEGFLDRDGDGYGDDAMAMPACPGSPGWAPRGGDCNDDPLDANARAQNPGQPEICDLIRNDCSALDPDVGAGAVNWYGDADGDGFGSASTSVTASCVPVPNASLLSTDCVDDPANPEAAMINPAAAERCNGADDNCNGRADFRIVGNDFEDDDGDGLVDLMCAGGTDCNDSDPTSGPGEVERCDMRDNDCDGMVDEGATSAVYYRDLDRDGYGSIASGSVVSCMLVPGFVPNAGDCNDTDALRFPGATETCDGADQDCDAAVDETPASTTCSLPSVTMSTCVSGRCLIDECTVGRDDCDGRSANGCETDLYTDLENCGRCGRGCIGGVCGGGACSRSTIGGGALARVQPRATTYTIDAPGSGASIAYTTDGSTPLLGAPGTIYTAAPAVFTLTGTTRVRWRAYYPTGLIEDVQEFQHTLDTRIFVPGEANSSTAPSDNSVAILENLNIAGQGPIATVAPGATVNVTVDAQYWRSQLNGYCTGCAIYMGITRATETGAFPVTHCLGNVFATYPGSTSLRSFSYTAPTVPGRYPLYFRLELDFLCNTGPGTEIGYIVVTP